MSKSIAIKNPATGEIIQQISLHSEGDIEFALQKSHEAFSSWSRTDAHTRSRLLKHWAKKITDHKEELAKLITMENGKPLSESVGEVSYALDYIEWYAEEAKRLYGKTIPANHPNKKIIVSRQSVGPVAAITPWNFPVAMMARKAAPALAAGCTFVVKLATDTPLSGMRFIELAHKAGIPEFVIQYVNAPGRLAGQLFTESPFVRKMTFTGSTAVGKELIKNSASTVKHVTMELGGHAPVIVAQDANIDHAVQQIVMNKFRNAGQTCISANRILVDRSIKGTFAQKLAEAVKKLKVGNGLEEDVQVGPMIHRAGYEKVYAHIEDALLKGGKILTGHQYDIDEEKGVYFVEPTVIDEVTVDMKLMTEETFGPVAPIIGFSSLEEAVHIANDTPYGLAAYFFTKDYRTGIYLHDHLDFGIIGWNDTAISAAHVPFGGMKESGLGREGGLEGIEPYLETKYLSIGY